MSEARDPTWALDPTMKTPGASAPAGSSTRDRFAQLAGQFIDKMLGGRYLLRRLVGAGGFGAVFEAEDQRIKKRVAVKLLFSDLLRDREAVLRFKLEAESASQVGHRNIVSITDFDFTEDGTAFMVMEFLEGSDLSRVIAGTPRPDLSRMVLLCLQACRGLAAAHRKGIVHRDLKPGNLFVCREEDGSEVVKVVDFGISRASELEEGSERLTKTGQILGTPYYMSPEQADGTTDVDNRSDIYSMGIILYEAFTGKLPFLARTPIGVLTKHATEAPRPLRQLNPELPPLLENTVLKALEKRREDRFKTMEEMEAALLGCLNEVDPRAASAELAAHRPLSQQGEPPLSRENLIALTTPQSALRRTGPEPITATTPAAGGTSRALVITVAVAVVAAVVTTAVVMRQSGDRRGRHTETRVIVREQVGRDAGPPLARPDAAVRAAVDAAPTVKAPDVVRLTCTSTPDTVELVLPGGAVLGGCQAELRLPRGEAAVELTVRAKGYVSQTVKVIPSAPRDLGALKLHRVSAGPAGMTGPLPDDPIPE